MNLKKISIMDSILNVFVLIFALINLFPLYWAITSSLKFPNGFNKVPPDWIPLQITFDNYVELFVRSSALRWTLNSIIISLAGTFLLIMFSVMASYAFSKIRFFGSKVLFIILVSSLMIPKEVLIIPLFKIVQGIGWTGTYGGLIIPETASAFGVFLLKQFIDTIPDSLRESGKIDGASEWKILTKIIVPIAMPGIGVLAILMFVRIWNDYLWQLVITNRNEMKTLQLGIASLQQENVTNYAFVLAGATVAAIPMLIVFFSFQKYFTKGITMGAVKG